MTAKTASKNAARKLAKVALPAVLAPVDAKKLHALVQADCRAMLAVGKAGQSEYQAFKTLLLAAPLNNAQAMIELAGDIRATFGEAHGDAAQIRITILNNARKVAHGGTKDKHAVAGRGHSAVVEAADSVTSIRELRKAMAAAKPEGLKDNRGGDTSKPKAKAKPKAESALPSVPKSASRADAFAAALKVLAFIEAQFLKPGTDADLIASIESTCAALKQAA